MLKTCTALKSRNTDPWLKVTAWFFPLKTCSVNNTAFKGREGKTLPGAEQDFPLGLFINLLKVLALFLVYNHFEIADFCNHQKGCRLDT